MPVLADTISHSVKDPLSTYLIGEEIHRPGSSPHFPEVSLQDIGGADLLPQLPGKRVVMETVVRGLIYAFDRPFFLSLPLIVPPLVGICTFC